MSRVEHFAEVANPLVERWNRGLRELRAEHPDLTDVLDRTWTWIDGELYRHDGLTWTRDMVLSPALRGPSTRLIAEPGHTWCERCRKAARP